MFHLYRSDLAAVFCFACCWSPESCGSFVLLFSSSCSGGAVACGVCCVVVLSAVYVLVSAVEFGSGHWLLSTTSSAPAPVQLQVPSKTHESRLFSLVE